MFDRLKKWVRRCPRIGHWPQPMPFIEPLEPWPRPDHGIRGEDELPIVPEDVKVAPVASSLAAAKIQDSDVVEIPSLGIRSDLDAPRKLRCRWPADDDDLPGVYCLGFLFSSDMRHVVLINKNRPAWQSGLWNGVGGKIKNRESGRQAMVREFREETGMETSEGAWDHVLTMSRNGEGAFTCYVFRGVASTLDDIVTMTDEPVKSIAVRGIEELPLVPSVRWTVPLCLDMEAPMYEIMGTVGKGGLI